MSGWDEIPSGPCISIPGYEILEQVGSGSEGTVYRGIHTSNCQQVAIKRIDLAGSSRDFPLFSVPEIRNLCACQQLSTVVQLKDIIVQDRQTGISVFMVMEYMDHSLRMRLNTPGYMFDENVTRKIMFAIISGIADLHNIGIVHMDIKPDNILVSRDGGIVKLCDLGLAKVFDTYHDCSKGTFPAFSPSSRPIGTRSYIAPEMLCENEYSAAVDLWSAGCVMAELLCIGQRLFPGPDVLDQLNQIFDLFEVNCLPGLRDKIPPSKLSSQGFDFLTRLLTIDPRKRISASEAVKHPWFSMRVGRRRRNVKQLNPPWHY